MRHFLDQPVGWIPPRLAEVYDETSFWSARFGAHLFDHLEIRRAVRGLDVGCGTGFPLIEVAQLHGTSSHFIGIDVWAAALERARLKVQAHGLTNVEIIQADAASMPFARDCFDLVISNIGVNNFQGASQALRECRRVAKTGGRLVLTTNVRGHFGAVYALLDAILGEMRLEPSRAALRREEDHRYSEQALANLLTDSGFSVARTFERSFPIRFADGSSLLRHSLVKWFIDGWRRAIGSEHERRIFDILESRLNATAERDMWTEMTVPMLYIECIAR